MTDIATLEVELDLDSGQFNAKLTKAGASIKKFGSTVDKQSESLVTMKRQMDGVGDALVKLHKLAMGFAGFEIIKSGVKDLIDAQKSLQQIQYGLKGALGTAAEAANAYSYISKESQKLGLNLQVTATEFTKVTAAATAMNVPMSQQKKLFDALARAQTVMHLSTDQVKYSTMALAQMFGKGKIQAEELRRQIGEQIPGVVPRFQNAVMQMVKGTDLAGKSFDQLLKAGALTTDKFLPALIQALQESGRGADEASQGLNANLNRLSTAWFKLKASMTSGLFNDALIASVSALAAHLGQLAAAALAVSAVMGAKYLGGKVAKGAGKVERIQQETKGAAAAAAAEKQWQEQVVKSNASIIEQNTRITANREAQIARNTELLESIKLTQDQARADIAAAEATIAHQKSTVGLTANYRARAKAELQLQIATAQLTKAERAEAETATVLFNAKQRLLENERAIIAATEAQTVARGALTEAEEAAAITSTARLGSAAKSLGSGLLALVGGPIGATILAIAGLGYGISKVIEINKEYHKQTKQMGQDLQDLTNELDAAAEAYGKFGSKENASAAVSAFTTQSDALTKYKADLADLIKQRDDLHASSSMSAFGGPGAMIGIDNELSKVNDRIETLRNKIGPAQDALDALGQKMNFGLTPAIDGVKEALDRLKAGASFGNVFKGLLDGANNSIKSMDEAKANFDKIVGEMDASRAVNEKKAETIGKTRAQLENDRYQKALTYLKQQKIANADLYQSNLEQLNSTHAAALKDAEAADAAVANKKAQTKAENALRQAESQRKSQFDGFITRIKERNAQDLESLNLSKKLTPEERLRASIMAQMTSAKIKLNQTQKDAIKTALDELVVNGKRLKQMNDQIRATQQLKQLQDKLNGEKQTVRQADQATLAGIGVSTDEQQRLERRAAISREYTQNLKDLNASRKNMAPEDYEKQKNLIKQQYTWRLTEEKNFQAQKTALEQDSTNGFLVGLHNYIDGAKKMGVQMQQVAQDAMSQLTDTLTTLVTTGKASFKDLFTYLLKEIVHVLMAKAVAKLVDLLMSIGGGSSMSQASSFNSSSMAGSSNFSAATYSANGNVMTPAGPAQLNYYENGGIARSPQLSIFGEGRLPEAYVPLPDGRSIPVTMKGGGAGGGMQNNVSVNVNVDNSGNADGKSDGSNDNAKKLGQMLDSKVRSVMAREMRQGGLLWKMRNNNG